MTSFLKSHPLLKIINGALRDLPSPSSIHSFWNLGSLLGLCLLIQIFTGLFLAFHYSADTSLSFSVVTHISRDVNSGFLLRMAHANGASMFFICIYLHIARGLYFGSFRFQETWSIGLMILLMVMASAFMGYVLPWGQMSFWGATVITNLFSAIPHLGPNIVTWLWGGFAVDNPTLTRFFSFHFLIPLLTTAFVAAHLLFLHQSGSSNPLGLSLNSDKIPFHPYFSVKDLSVFSSFSLILFLLVFTHPWELGDPENFIPANPLVTPVHIQPEWYFLFAYAILRSIPNKLGGVVALACSVLILLILPFFKSSKFATVNLYPPTLFYLWMFFNEIFLLTWIGARPVEMPFILTGQILTFFYFLFYFTFHPSMYLWDQFLSFQAKIKYF